MLYRDICRIVGFFTIGFSLALIVPLLVGLYFQFIADPSLHPQPHANGAFLESIAIGLLVGFILLFIGRDASGHLFRREGLAAVVIIWFLAPVIAAMPFFLSHTLKDPSQAYFECTSGLTTTGSTVLHAKKYDPVTGEEIPYQITWLGVRDTTYTFYGTVPPIKDPVTGAVLHEGIEAVTKSLLFWRSFMEFLGGLGIIVLFVAILPALGVGGKVLFQAEATGPIKDTWTPRIKEMAMQLWKIYTGLMIIQVILLMATNGEMGWFDAVTIGFSTLSTGGYSVRNASIASYQSATTEWIVIVFMIFGSINFTLYYYAIKGKFFRVYDKELLIYFAIMIVACILIIWNLQGTEKTPLVGEHDPGSLLTWGEATRYGVFQLVSAQSTSGFVTIDFDAWPYIVQVILIIAMYFGGMSGSTASGIKIIRLYMLFKIVQYKVETLFRPQTVRSFRLGDRSIDASSTTTALCFFVTIAAISIMGIFLYVLNGVDIETAVSLVASMVNNSGLTFRMAGPTQSCAFLTDFGTMLSSVLMILGRLEFFAILALLVPAFWKQTS